MTLAAAAGASGGCFGLAAVVHGVEETRIGSPLPASPHGAAPGTAAQVRRTYGAPDTVARFGTQGERWRYRTGVRLHGLSLLILVVPIPLVVPTGIHHREVDLEHGAVVRIRETRNARVARIGCLYGALLAALGEQGCFAEWRAAKPPPQLEDDSGHTWTPIRRAGPAPEPHTPPPR